MSSLGFGQFRFLSIKHRLLPSHVTTIFIVFKVRHDTVTSVLFTSVSEEAVMMPIVAFHGTWAVNVDATMWHDYLGKEPGTELISSFDFQQMVIALAYAYCVSNGFDDAIFPFVNGRCHLWQSMPFVSVDAICNSRCHLWQSMPFVTVDAICESRCHLKQQSIAVFLKVLITEIQLILTWAYIHVADPIPNPSPN